MQYVVGHISEMQAAPFLMCLLGMVILYSLKFYNNGGKVHIWKKKRLCDVPVFESLSGHVDCSHGQADPVPYADVAQAQVPDSGRAGVGHHCHTHVVCWKLP